MFYILSTSCSLMQKSREEKRQKKRWMTTVQHHLLLPGIAGETQLFGVRARAGGTAGARVPLCARWIDLAATVTCIIVTIVMGGVITIHTPVRVRHTQLLHIKQDYQNNPRLVYFHLSYRLTILFMFWLMRILWMRMGCMQSSSCSFKITTFFKPYLAWTYNFTHDSLGHGKKELLCIMRNCCFSPRS